MQDFTTLWPDVHYKSHRIWANLNKWVLRLVVQISVYIVAVMCGGKMFQASGPAWEKALSPNLWWIAGCSKRLSAAERRLSRPPGDLYQQYIPDRGLCAWHAMISKVCMWRDTLPAASEADGRRAGVVWSRSQTDMISLAVAYWLFCRGAIVDYGRSAWMELQ